MLHSKSRNGIALIHQVGKQPSSILWDIYVLSVPLTILNSVGWNLLSVQALGYPKPNSLKKNFISPINVCTLDNFGVFGFNVRNGKNNKLTHSSKSSFETCVYSALRYLTCKHRLLLYSRKFIVVIKLFRFWF